MYHLFLYLPFIPANDSLERRWDPLLPLSLRMVPGPIRRDWQSVPFLMGLTVLPHFLAAGTLKLSNNSEGRASPHDVLEDVFAQKVGAFVNKPINQVALTSLDIPFAMFAPKNLQLEEANPMENPWILIAPEVAAVAIPMGTFS